MPGRKHRDDGTDPPFNDFYPQPTLGAEPPSGVEPIPLAEPNTLEITPIPVIEVEEDWMERAREQAEGLAWEPGNERPEVEEVGDDDTLSGGSASLVRPYARTGGRTKPVRHLDLEALVHTTVGGKEASTGPWLNPEHMSIIDMCTGTVSVAEVAARLSVPIGVARVIIADMVDLGLVEIMKTSASDGDERDPAFLRRVLSGLQRL